MILEVAMLHVRPGQEAEFEAAFSAARKLIAASPDPFPVVEHYVGVP